MVFLLIVVSCPEKYIISTLELTRHPKNKIMAQDNSRYAYLQGEG